MNPETIIEMQNRLTNVEQVASDTLKAVKAITIDSQRYLKSNVKIPPGISSKVAYDANGLIIKGDKLLPSDIPLLHIDGIEGLRKLLEDKVSKTDILNLNRADNHLPKRGETIVGTGTKINYDENGLIISSADLEISDIPKLPISHIKNLQEMLDILKSTSTPDTEIKDIPKIDPGTFTKITYDPDGRVVSGSNLSIDDIPMELITRMNILEGYIPTLALNTAIDTLASRIKDKVQSNPDITPGEYTKVTVDTQGLVTKGARLTTKDLPSLSISDIVDLFSTLENKVERSVFMEMNDTVSALVGNMNNIGDLSEIKSTLKMKAEDSEVKSIAIKLSSMQHLLDVLTTTTPNELILEQLNQIQNDLSTIAGRVTVLEKKFGIEDSFKE